MLHIFAQKETNYQSVHFSKLKKAFYPIEERAAYWANSNNFKPRAPIMAPESRLIFFPPIMISLL